MRKARVLAGLVVIAMVATAVSWLLAADRSEQVVARRLLQTSGVQGGLVVHLGCGEGRLTAALHASDSYLVQGLDRKADRVARARKFLLRRGLYGKVTVDRLVGDRLPYIENLVNLLVVEDPSGISEDEMMRVVAPLGVVYIKRGGRWEKRGKPWPKEIDEWTHYLHDAT
ncbi:MAG: class I SAM-dependent methyltransferase, partial [Armatimonadetes bacterium]|nr:class I SAM-dependent methyltransferase [Armatimonadota bacterium]